MRLLVVILSLICAFLYSCGAIACETEATATPASDCVVMKRGETRGVWFELKRADELRRGWAELPELRLQIDSYRSLEQIRSAQLEAYREASEARNQVIQDLGTTNEILVRDASRARSERDEALASRDAWYRSPFLWVGVGVVLTVAAGGTVALVLN